jgi:hypothetical protein
MVTPPSLKLYHFSAAGQQIVSVQQCHLGKLRDLMYGGKHGAVIGD